MKCRYPRNISMQSNQQNPTGTPSSLDMSDEDLKEAAKEECKEEARELFSQRSQDMAGRALYQKYRPSTFDEIVEQPQAVTVLKKAIESGTPAHAYLFTGPHGIGKTSIARIFARSLKCKDIDIFEIDAASHTGVENMRDLTMSVYTRPVESVLKVYILDEVHMLSKAAFNAFLKTLEEPPAHAIFILVTTEIEKVPGTVISRCMLLHLRQPSLTVLQQAVESVAKKEGCTLKEQSAALIALMAEGSFRDALTLTQKVLSVADAGGEVSHDMVEKVLGAPHHRVVNKYLEALTSSNFLEGVTALKEVRESKVSMDLFVKLCIQKVRTAALLSVDDKTNVAEEYNEEDEQFIKDISSKNEVADLFGVIKGLTDATNDIPTAHIKTLPLEFLLLKNEKK